MLIHVTSSELTLKGKNRKIFENILLRNIRASLESFGSVKISKKGTSRFLITIDGNPDKKKARNVLTKVFGIDNIYFAEEVASDIEQIREFVLSNSNDLKGKTIKVNTKRSDKKYPLTSPQVNEIIGKDLVNAGCTVDLKNPEANVFIDIIDDHSVISFEKIKGLGGLPVGSSGKVLSLFSGGIDSPVASWLMMKRGCRVDFFHMHSFKSNTDIKKSKIIRIAQKLREYSPRPIKIFVAPYNEFYKKTLSIDPKNELVVFRRFLLKMANRLARKYRYKGIVTGDSIGQVASQTLDNILATNEASKLPVFRPLTAFNKVEIVNLATGIGTYEKSLEEYKDCCSLVANKSPLINTSLYEVKKIEKEIDVDSVVEKTLKLCEVLEV